MKSVFRFQVGDNVILFNGDGYDYVSEIVSITKSGISFHVTQSMLNQWKPRLRLTIAVSMIKKDNFEWIVQKVTELGVSEIIPLLSDRSEKKGWNRERAKKIIIEACEQSGRSDIPVLGDLVVLSEFVNIEKRKTVVFHTENNTTVYGSNENIEGEEIVVIVGPEGGWSEREIEMFREKKYMMAKLPTPILRAETAAIAIVSILLAK